jgi:hypothetical protein
MSPVHDVNNITKDQVVVAMNHGFSFTCAMCLKLHEGHALARGYWGNTKCTGKVCSGPMGGASYPEYEGPIKDMFTRFCYMCGQENPPRGASYNAPGCDPSRVVGMCEKHYALVRGNKFEVDRETGTRKKSKVRIAGHEVELEL